MNEKTYAYSKKHLIGEAAKVLSALAVGVGGTALVIDNYNPYASHHVKRIEIAHKPTVKNESLANVFFMGKQICLNGVAYRPVKDEYGEYKHIPDTACNANTSSTNVQISGSYSASDYLVHDNTQSVSTGNNRVSIINDFDPTAAQRADFGLYPAIQNKLN